ncbi:MAG: hypothetical protein M1818_005994 [Claussenomyces sp. TS43310]|nr:MAG: hypothetical protein M1818_005994 [Claussenomyces sp. TS43310]
MPILATLAMTVVAAKDSRTFAVNHFYGTGPLTMGRMDPIISPGEASAHVHAIQGGSNFALTMSDDTLLDSNCTSSLVKNDKSNYWTPALYFQDPTNGSFTSVPMFYMNVYYFFEATDDDIQAFQPGHRMVVGSPFLRTPPATGGESITDTNYGTPQPIQWTCPRSNYDTPSYPVDSDGLHGAGIVDPNNQGSGVGFPDMNCDGYSSPLRADIHFPSCYNPAVGLDDYKNNMAWPSSANTTAGKANCPAGYIHTPHLFYEVYWNTPLFVDRWTQGQGTQPFVLADGDPTGYSLHADFISGWDVATLQQVIDNCDTGDSGMDTCPGLIGGLNDPSTSCNIANLVPEDISGEMTALPGNNPITGFGATVVPAGSDSSPATSSTAAAPTSSAASTSAASTAAAVVATPTASSASSGKKSVSGWTETGCYSDSGSTRALSGITFANLGQGKVTTTGCITYCNSNGYSIAGTEYGGQCFCGNTLVGSSLLDDSKCNMPCEGDSTQTCGGSDALTVYSKSGSAKRAERHLHRHIHQSI